MKIGIIDLDTGNLGSLISAMDKLNIKYKICRANEDLSGIKKIILPGVGAFKDFMKKIKQKGIDKNLILKSKNNTSILGVCLGFQILFIHRIGFKFDAFTSNYFQAITIKADNFTWIICQQAHFTNTAFPNDLCANAILTEICWKT